MKEFDDLINEMFQYHPPATETITISHNCPKCHGTGWEMVNSEGQGTVRECSCGCRKCMIQKSKLEFACIPLKFSSLMLEDFRTDMYGTSENMMIRSMEVFKRFINEFSEVRKGFYFHSQTKGSGKTMLAAIIGNELIKIGHTVKFTTTTNLLQEIKATWDDRNDHNSESKLLNDLKRTEILILDDIGIDGYKPWINERFFSILDERMTSNRITIFTSNFSLNDLPVDDRIKSRINSMVINFPFPEVSVRNIVAEQERMEEVKRLKGES